MKKLVKVGAGFISMMPLLALAQGANLDTGYIGNTLQSATRLLNNVVIFLIAFAVVWFIYNVVKYSMSSDEDGKEKARSQMIWGVIALAVIVSVWGLVNLLQGVFGVGQGPAANVGNLLPRN